MNKVIFLLLSSLFILSSCKKATQFNVDYDSQIVISSSLGQIIPFSVTTPSVTTNSEAEFQANDTDKDHLEKVLLQELVLTITSPSNETFSFLDDVEIYISSPNHSEVLIAFKNNIPNSVGNQIVCGTTSEDIQKYIIDDSFKIRVNATTDETIPNDVYINVYSNFFVDAKIFK